MQQHVSLSIPDHLLPACGFEAYSTALLSKRTNRMESVCGLCDLLSLGRLLAVCTSLSLSRAAKIKIRRQEEGHITCDCSGEEVKE